MDSFFKNVKDSENLNNQKEKTFLTINIILVPIAEVGKTSFLLRIFFEGYKEYMENDSHLHATISPDFATLKLNYRDKFINFIIWDTPQVNTHYFYYSSNLFRKAEMIFLFYDSSYKYSLDSIKEILDPIYWYCKSKPIFALIRNKYDKNGKIEISDEEALEFADKKNMLFFHLSLHEKNETGVKELFETILNEYFIRKEKEKNEDEDEFEDEDEDEND